MLEVCFGDFVVEECASVGIFAFSDVSFGLKYSSNFLFWIVGSNLSIFGFFLAVTLVEGWWGEASSIFSGLPPPPLTLVSGVGPLACCLPHLELSSGMFFNFSILLIAFLRKCLNFNFVVIGL